MAGGFRRMDLIYFEFISGIHWAIGRTKSINTFILLVGANIIPVCYYECIQLILCH